MQPSIYATAALSALIVCAAGCTKPKTPGVATPEASAAPPAETAEQQKMRADADAFFDPKTHASYLTGEFINVDKLSPTQRKYGVAPQKDPRVHYAADVIFMEHGDKAVTGAGTDGMTYAFDAAADHVGDFAEGKIVFATSRVVGRIARLEKDGSRVIVMLAPVQLTDVVEDGEFRFDSDIDPSKMLIYTAPGFPSTVDVTPPGERSARLEEGRAQRGGAPPVLPARFESEPGTAAGAAAAAAANGKLPPMPPPPGAPDPSDYTNLPMINLVDDAFTAKPIAGPTSVGVEYWYNKDGTVVNAWGSLHLENAHLRFILKIANKSVVNFGIQLTGGLGLKLHLDSHSNTDRFVNAHQTVDVPCDITLPTAIIGLPLAITFHESFNLSTGFSAKSSLLKADADYGLTGQLFVGWLNGSPTFDPSLKHYAKVDIGRNVYGLSVGINSLVMAFSERVMVGIGAFGFNTGVYASVVFSGSVLKQSNTTWIDCKAGYMTGTINSGVGYSMPSVVAKFATSVISLFTRYKVADHGTIIAGPTGQFMNIDSEVPTRCATPKSGTA